MERLVLKISAALLMSGAVFAADPAAFNVFDATQYCVQSGGQAVKRLPFFNTNGPESEWLQLMGNEIFCQFTAEDGSRIHITLETLYSAKPSLAALAYYNKPAPETHEGSGNPSSFYCSQLGGTDLFGGVNAAGGGWVNKDATDVVVAACIFPDMSSIDSWGLFYHANGIIRGIDLSKVLRFQPKQSAKTDRPRPVHSASAHWK